MLTKSSLERNSTSIYIKNSKEYVKYLRLPFRESGGEERCALNTLRLLGSYLKVQVGDAPPGTASATCAQEYRDACVSIVPQARLQITSMHTVLKDTIVAG